MKKFWKNFGNLVPFFNVDFILLILFRFLQITMTNHERLESTDQVIENFALHLK